MIWAVSARPGGSGIDTVDGFRKSADFQYGLDLHTDYKINVGESSS